MKHRILVILWLALSIAPATAQVRENPLAAARELYASARYDEALAVLNGLRTENAAGAERKSIAQYRSLCLLALGRGEEAEEAIAIVVTTDPLFQPTEAEAAPRVRAAFSEVRERLLPEIVRTRYAEAKQAFDRKQHQQAEEQFRHVLALLDDPQMGGRLPDLRVLAAGFLELSAAAAAPPPPAVEESKPEPPPAPTPIPEPGRIYVAEDDGVTPPETIQQDLPPVPASIMTQIRERGLLEIVIDESGRVNFMAMRIGVHPHYDPILLAAARNWKYTPATVRGVPVPFRKLIRITSR